MTTQQHLAKHMRDVFFGGNWTFVNLKTTLADVTWEQAVTKVGNLNTIATLFYHIGYYVGGVSDVLDGNPLVIKDIYSFAHPPINNADDWNSMQQTLWDNVTQFAEKIEKLSDEQLNEVFFEEKYGTYYRNLAGIIEHTHYHLGQISLIKKLLAAQA